MQNRSNVRPRNGSYSIGLVTPSGGFPSSGGSDNYELQVAAGDVIDIEVYGYYTQASPSTGDGQLVVAILDNANNYVDPPGGSHFIFDHVTDYGRPANQWNRLSAHFQVPYNMSNSNNLKLWIYTWNPSASMCWFDDLKVTKTHPVQGSVVYVPDVESSTDYYAFGAPMTSRSFSSSKYRYGFNGKENDRETVGTGSGTQDYGLRIYNPAIGKFLSVDPLTRTYPMLTPYQFASNTPIVAIDLDGLEKAVSTYAVAFAPPALVKVDQAITRELAEKALQEAVKKEVFGTVTRAAEVAAEESIFVLARTNLTVLFVFMPLEMGDQDPHPDPSKFHIPDPAPVEKITTNPLTEKEAQEAKQRIMQGKATQNDLIKLPQINASVPNINYLNATQGTTILKPEYLEVLSTASTAYKGSTILGHALSKHAGRNPSILGKLTGNPSTWHLQALKHFDEIMYAPGEFIKTTNKDGIDFLEKKLPDGRGIRLNMNGAFKGFID